MARTGWIRASRIGMMPVLALLVLAALLAGLMTPATAEAPFDDVEVTFVDPPTTAAPGGAIGVVEVAVSGTITLDVLDLVDGEGTLPLTASIALLQEGEPVPDPFDGLTKVDVVSVGSEGAAEARATFDGLTLSDDLVDGAYVLRATIDLGDIELGTATADLEVSSNAAPVAGFSWSCDELTLECQFEDTSADDGDIEKWEWDFGDETPQVTILAQDVDEGDTTHTYGSLPTLDGYEVKLTVTDDGGLTGTSKVTLTASDFSSDFDEVKDCDEETCDFEKVIDGVTYTIQGPVASEGRVGVSFDIVPDAAFRSACEALQETFSSVRVLEPVTLVVPTGFSAGDVFTVTMVVPKRIINQDTNRGNFGVCFRDEAPQEVDEDDPSHVFKGTTRLLPDCGGADAACVVSRNKAKNGTLTMTFRFPAVDPMFR
jgi:PKD repeat protein